MNVLLVDDEPLELEQLEFLIHRQFPNWTLHLALDVDEALRINEKFSLHLALLDIHLPGISGLQLGEKLKSNNSNLDIIIVTAYQNFDYAKQSIRLGVIDYITKPIIEKELIDILQKYKGDSNTPSYSRIIQDTLDIIHETFHDKLHLADIAAKVHTNPTYLSRRFHEEVGISFSGYIMQYRIEMSQKYLTEHPHWCISQISERSGFNSQHYFSTVFRKMTGMTPKEYRGEG
ncbi:DNA-binding response regulator [Bacillus cereus]|uniref:DNA-binding response regulator n=1 Tax=Bacillus cereus TaxID=1396 RepID=A0A2A8Y0K8_BACCE|nr:helix-turn-helix domain-containing protein [Bacillus cereus]PEC83870.1 DNA-binding response regulator [Bacillus cereus]PEQ45141.1 DNA-binding response regulator [Bacillus cereus]PEX36490.1 DNA-binding response regulator [Bacillus cereus]PFB19531.1 DNA-binding response regulator [Bacillus cereus]PFB62580.1 DNA-binding response regulator [Bacillus cereus]